MMATRCCCPPDRRSGYSLAFCSRPMRFEQRHRLLLGLVAWPGAGTRMGARVTFSMHGHVREQVEALEDDADVAAQRG